MSRPHISIENALIEYYKLKDQYDSNYVSKKNSILSDETLALPAKKAKIDRLRMSRKCVICKSQGGTIFTDENRILKAVCGSKSQPCGLNIEIAKGKVDSVEELMIMSYKKIEEIKGYVEDEEQLKLKIIAVKEYCKINNIQFVIDYVENKEKYKHLIEWEKKLN